MNTTSGRWSARYYRTSSAGSTARTSRLGVTSMLLSTNIADLESTTIGAALLGGSISVREKYDYVTTKRLPGMRRPDGA